MMMMPQGAAVLRGHDSNVSSAAFSPDGSRIVTASLDNTARLWDAATAKEIDVTRDQRRDRREVVQHVVWKRIVGGVQHESKGNRGSPGVWLHGVDRRIVTRRPIDWAELCWSDFPAPMRTGRDRFVPGEPASRKFQVASNAFDGIHEVDGAIELMRYQLANDAAAITHTILLNHARTSALLPVDTNQSLRLVKVRLHGDPHWLAHEA